ncbi:AAA family ATPase [Croceibacterium ferulae]|uniref:AAA family ATPase n=1 Tax=Croceibacterium ferulae TaxID=1854641 RepID=UPI000EB4ECE9|nr:pilus assembly protein CpaE [Croceibacterium ferulae]
MNAPWKPQGARDGFAAFVCDDQTLDRVRSAAITLGFAPEKCVRGGLRSAIQALAVSTSPAILLVDLSDCADPVNEIQGLAEVCEPGTVVVALGQVNDVRLYRTLLASGLHDYLLKPAMADQLAEALASARAVLSAPRSGGAEGERPHAAIAVIGTRGGVGASTIAASLAWSSGTLDATGTALLDLDVHFGTAALAFDLEPGRGLADAIENPGRIDGLFIERAMSRVNANLAILSSEAPLSTALATDGTAFVRLLEEFRTSFARTVIDLPRGVMINFPQVLANVGTIVLVTELTLAGARDAIRMLAWLRAHAPAAQPVVVANRTGPGTGEIGRSEFETTIEGKIAHLVPLDPKAAATAAKQGQCLAEAARGSKTGAALAALQATIDAACAGDDGDGALVLRDPTGAPVGKAKFDLKALLGRARPGAKVAAS